MTFQQTSDIFQEAILTILRVGGPILIICLLVGVVMALIQAVTQIHEQSLAFVVKLAAVIAFLALAGSWMLQNIQEFTLRLFAMMAA